MIPMSEESVKALPKVVGFLRVLRFPPTGNVDSERLGLALDWDYRLTDPSTVAVLRDQTRVIRWLPEALLESLPLDHVQLRPSPFSLALNCK